MTTQRALLASAQSTEADIARRLRALLKSAQSIYELSNGKEKNISNLALVKEDDLEGQILIISKYLVKTPSNVSASLLGIIAHLIEVQKKQETSKTALEAIEVIKETQKAELNGYVSRYRYHENFWPSFEKFSEEIIEEIKKINLKNIETQTRQTQSVEEQKKEIIRLQAEIEKLKQQSYDDFDEITPLLELARRDSILEENYNLISKLLSAENETSPMINEIKKHQSLIEDAFKKFGVLEEKKLTSAQTSKEIDNTPTVSELKKLIQNIESLKPLVKHATSSPFLQGLSIFNQAETKKRNALVEYCKEIISRIENPPLKKLTEKQKKYFEKNYRKMRAEVEKRPTQLAENFPEITSPKRMSLGK